MAITSGDILTKVNQITKRGLTATADIEDPLHQALVDITRRLLALKTTVTGTTTNSYIDKPSDFVDVDAFYVDEIPLNPITFDEYLWDNVRGYVVYDDKIYFRYSSNSVDYTLYYSRQHPDDMSSILLGDKFKAAIYRLTAAYIYEEYELYDRQNYQLQLYEREIEKLESDDDDHPPITKPHNINTLLNTNNEGYK